MSLIIANWKMNPTSEQAVLKLVNDIIQQDTLPNGGQARYPFSPNGFVEASKMQDTKTKVVFCAPSLYIKSISQLLNNASNFSLGAQNCFYEEFGTYTGEISAKMLADLGVKYCIAGHSERKKYFGETIEDVKKKISALLKNNIIPVVCLGEDDRTKKLSGIENQLNDIINDIPKSKLEKIIFVYEPAWAISDGENPVKDLPSSDDILSAKLLFRKTLSRKISKKNLDNIKIIYGGSVTSNNVGDFVGENLMDGALVGGASLKAKEFGKIVKNFSSTSSS